MGMSCMHAPHNCIALVLTLGGGAPSQELSRVGGVRCGKCNRLWHEACTGVSGEFDECLICNPAQHEFYAKAQKQAPEQLTIDTCKGGMVVVHEAYGEGKVVEDPHDQDN